MAWRAATFRGDGRHSGSWPVRHPTSPPSEAWSHRPAERLYSSPAVLGDAFYLLAVGRDRAWFGGWSLASGQPLWEHAVSYPSPCWWYSCAVRDERVFAFDYGSIAVLHGRTGQLLASREMPRFWAPSASPTLEGDVLLFAGNDACIYALSADTLAERWRYAVVDGPPIYSSPAVFDSRVYFCACGTARGTCYSVRLHDGRELWRRPVPPEAGVVRTSPCLCETTLYVQAGFSADTLLALDPDTGTLRWQHSLAAPAPAVPLLGVGSSPAARDGRVYFASLEGRVSAATSEGSMVWEVEVAGSVESPPVLAENVLYIAATTGQLSALDPDDGRALWTHDLGDAIVASPALESNGLLVATAGGRLHALRW